MLTLNELLSPDQVNGDSSHSLSDYLVGQLSGNLGDTYIWSSINVNDDFAFSGKFLPRMPYSHFATPNVPISRNIK